MYKMLVSIPNELAMRFRVAIPQKQRSKVITNLISQEIEKREKKLYECALAVEKDPKLNNEMLGWDVTLIDGLQEVDGNE